MKVIIDAQLPPVLAQVLRLHGFDAVHVVEIGLLAATDIQIAAFVAAEHAVIFTKDTDFAQIQRRGAGSLALKVVWIRFGNLSSRTLIARVLASMPKLVERLNMGESLIELR